MIIVEESNLVREIRQLQMPWNEKMEWRYMRFREGFSQVANGNFCNAYTDGDGNPYMVCVFETSDGEWQWGKEDSEETVFSEIYEAAIEAFESLFRFIPMFDFIHEEHERKHKRKSTVTARKNS